MQQAKGRNTIQLKELVKIKRIKKNYRTSIKGDLKYMIELIIKTYLNMIYGITMILTGLCDGIMIIAGILMLGGFIFDFNLMGISFLYLISFFIAKLIISVLAFILTGGFREL